MKRIATAVAYSAHALEHRVFLRWHDAVVANRADRAASKRGEAHFRQRACRGALAVWRRFAARHGTTRARLRVVMRFWRGHTLHDFFARWVAHHREARRQRGVQVSAMLYWKGHCMSSAFRKWVKYYRNRVHLKRQFAARSIQVRRRCCVHAAACVAAPELLWGRSSLQLTRRCACCAVHCARAPGLVGA